MSNLLFVLWIALIAADRIDLAGGHGPFMFTPFLALTPVVIVSEIVRRRTNRHQVLITRRALLYTLVLAALMSTMMLSVFGAPELPVSAERVALVIAQMTGTLLVALLCQDRNDLGRLLARGAILSLPLFVIFNFAEALCWIGWLPETVRFGTVSLAFDDLQNVGPFPRLAGLVGDSNRAGFVLVFYAVVIALGEPKRLRRSVAIALTIGLLLFTFSRSATLAALGVLAVAAFTERLRLSRRLLLVPAIFALVAAGFGLVRPDALTRALASLEKPIAQRLSPSVGSAPAHIELIERGVEEGTASVPRSLLGIGFGNGYLLLQDIFSGNRYGNFHSLYVTMFAEAGVFSLVLALCLMVPPLFMTGPWRPLIAGALAFNVFYQTTSEPVFWFLLASAWLAIPLVRRAAAGDAIGAMASSAVGT